MSTHEASVSINKHFKWPHVNKYKFTSAINSGVSNFSQQLPF